MVRWEWGRNNWDALKVMGMNLRRENCFCAALYCILTCLNDFFYFQVSSIDSDACKTSVVIQRVYRKR